MRFGICASPSRWRILSEIGYDYAEFNLSALAAVTDEKLEQILTAQRESGIKVEVCNGFFPSDFHLYAINEGQNEDHADLARVKESVRQYTERAFSRANALGVTVTVLGSSGARTIPEGVDRAVAERQFLELLRLCGKIGDKYGIAVTVEPLNYTETNFINTLSDGLDLVRRAAHPNVRAMVDFFHHYYNKESMSVLASTRGALAHTHLANRPRLCPRAIDADFVAERLRALQAIGYDGRVSLECGFGDDFEREASEAYGILKHFR